MITLLLYKSIKRSTKLPYVSSVFSLLLIVIFTYVIAFPYSFLWEKIDRQEEFFTNYGQFLINGDLIRDTASSRSTLFVDGWESLLYWQAKLPSSYPYLFYYPPMAGFSVYTNAKARMYKVNSPDYVSVYCGKEGINMSNYFPDSAKNLYSAFYYKGRQTCLFIKKSNIPNISSLPNPPKTGVILVI